MTLAHEGLLKLNIRQPSSKRSEKRLNRKLQRVQDRIHSIDSAIGLTVHAVPMAPVPSVGYLVDCGM